MSKIAIYAGHGGTDSGAVGQKGELEKDYTLKISSAAINCLKSAGHEVITNRTADVKRDITDDANRANAENVDCVAEIHLNSNSGTPATGSEVFYSITGGVGKDMAQAILDKIVSLGYKSRGIKTKTNSAGKDYFGIIRQTKAPAVLVEVCFINNPEDMARLDCEAAGKAIAQGVMAVFGGSSLQENVVSKPAATEKSSYDGKKKAKVSELQRILNSCYNSGLAVDGIWGPKTAAACSKNLLRYKTPMISTTYVTYIQQLLGVAGYGTKADGKYGPDTKSKVVEFQRSVCLSADGVVGKDTCLRLIEVFAERA